MYSNKNKLRRLVRLVNYFLNKYGAENIIVEDHWDGLRTAIGLTEPTRQYLVYIDLYGGKDTYNVILEDPPQDEALLYTDAGKFDNISFNELERLICRHLRLTVSSR